jgi:long-chain fatty acid transport protein
VGIRRAQPVRLTYTSEAKADLEGDLDFHNVGPVLGPIHEATRLNGANIKVENILPQHVDAGFNHVGESGMYATIDVLWIDFSKFATGSVSLDGTDLDVDDGGGFRDFGGVTVGVGMPRARYTRSAGAFYVTSPVKNSERTLALALDRMWGAGVGISIPRMNSRKIDVNFNVVNYGDAPVDTGPSLARGQIVGKNEDPYAIAIDASYQF